MVFASPFSVLADNAYSMATSSDALLPDINVSGDGFSSGDVGSLGVRVSADVYSDSGFLRSVLAKGSISGGSYYFKFDTLPDGLWYQNVVFNIGKSFLPKPGKYGFTFSFREGHVGFPDINASYVRIGSSGTNITESTEQIKASLGFVNGGWQIKSNVSIGYNTTLLISYIGIGLDCPRDLDMFLSKDCFQFTYKQNPDIPSVSAPDVDGGGSAENHIAENTGQLVEQQEETNGLLANIIQTISHQLTAFWNQLAGEFTNLFTKMNQQHDDNMDKLEDVKDGVTNKLDDVKDGITDKLEDTKKGIIAGIIDGLKSLFIPSNDFFKAWFDDLYSFFGDRLGFLMLPIDLLVNLVNLFIGADSGFIGIPFPEFKWIDGTVIIPAQNVQFEFLETGWGKEIQQMLYFVGNVIMIGSLLSLIHRKLEGVLRS